MTRPTPITIGAPSRPKLSRDGRTIVVSIPISLRRQGGRKCVVTPADSSPWSPTPARVDSTMVKALVRAHRWRGMLESNLFTSVRDLAKAEKINESYLCRVLRLTLLSPTLTEAILNGQQPVGLDLATLLKSLPVEWDRQEALLQQMTASG
ncbi:MULTISPECIES: hypothetical protein [unclassified Bradyrhizobium]|uniref:hypothetical protein n=1 Tax=unclassified Bradyrhizobium TaxID=2631580 RepID=UPI001BA4CF49|nr:MULTISPECIES: hypothetical protein [unclassified Bradyrhizobium]MBR1206085.1 hypothetical protein [Bradyrhizobium sp. AUGA SZCCT0124]MBR1314789.1 hypothetical protein [Bradyrhizobium sp. AUGA SZCCT0051]MBR1341760.1 hypothetical protein [Bradyrhizobium sp. AUGA SZCCT0105]MBR1358839.1 hypothetical protein [Bradyrhizobium sp. AUGA SZCCT0045]